ncbi:MULTISPECIES: response regulator [unclassified Paenibacillus]|uniref:response regulator transcription factor n=1 Tax=unclassified Paenibacillus TaxID=185978 RepID=UPI001AE43155|nr:MULTISPECIES: response regulator [unclassified Paenibacillus]MBP1156782.1 two-component system response regulator YesN [Paenibacillus sp. PvP091]MBP1172479.1 two-component system response regulator YesN [Paenibacillus sp. PvR098]MBP2438860.1 two-component system response regulator YesN [Paenibacillus sp. PvP052]
MLTLLIVDDESSVVETLAITIPWADMGIETVHKAFSAKEALDILNTYPVDIVLTDINMPVMNGLDLVGAIQERWRRTKCILLSGHAEFEYAQIGIQNHISGYLLKPVSDEELMDRVQQVILEIHWESSQNDAYERAMKVLRDHLPRLKGEFLHDLLQGKRLSLDKLQEKIGLLELPVAPGNEILMTLVRFKEDFNDYNSFEMSLMEFAIGNLATETFEEHFQVWQCKDVHEYLVLVLIPKNDSLPDRRDALVEHLTTEFQLNVQQYLKKRISVLVGQWGVFPESLTNLYNNLLLVFRKRIGSEQNLPVYMMDKSDAVDIQMLNRLYEPPTLMNLLEAGHWEAVEQKLEAALEELELHWAESSEHITETFFFIFSAFSFIAHKNGKKLADIIDEEYVKGKELTPSYTVAHLRGWVRNVYEKFHASAMQESRTARAGIVKGAQKYMLANLSQNISLQEISDHLRLHPAYLSRIYKLETGENISEYMTRLKLEKSVQLLMLSTMKIYEIAMEIGYQNPNYFNKVFKKHFGLTPQEYRTAKAQT